jgi:cellulose synthase/poly-beta-1,6-N-acetylglucosamine synthase-like glycosyltransferase
VIPDGLPAVGKLLAEVLVTPVLSSCRSGPVIAHPADLAPHAGIPDPQPFVSVIIPHYNDLDGLRLCHARLLAQDWPRSAFEIVVADNNSRCGLAAVRAVVPEAVVVAAPLQGAGPARNAAVAASRGTVLAFIDSDCLPERDWIRAGVEALRRHDFVGGRVLTLARDPGRPNAVEAFEIVFNFNFKRYIERVGFSGTGNLFVPRRVFDHVGGFRPQVAEDMEWCFRARAHGYRIGYAEHAVVGHPARRSWAELQRRWARMLAEDYGLARMQPRGRLIFVAKALAMPLSVLPHGVKVLASGRLPGPRARLAAILVLARLRLWRMGRMLRLAWQHG